MGSFKLTTEISELTYDVLVAGGGPAGVCAAVAAAREGAKTLLIEATGALGGMATMGLVPGWCGLHDQIRLIHNSLAKKIVMNSVPGPHEYDYVTKFPNPHIDAEHLKRFLDGMVQESGAELLFHTMLAGVLAEDGRVQRVILANKSGLQAVRASVYVDCTGDADLAAWAGARYYKDEMQPVSLCFALSGNDPQAQDAPIPDWKQAIIDDPKYPLIRDSFFGLASGSYSVHNSGHLWHVDNTDPRSMTRALIDGRAEAAQFLAAFREHFPKRCAESKLAQTAPLLGVRETRRIVGDYTLTLADHQARRRFSDDVALNSFFIDIHPSLEKRELERKGLWSWEKEKKDSRFGPGELHGIPYRCLTPQGLENVLVAGRSISCDREALSAVRIMPSCMSMGEAAGVAAAQAASGGKNVHAVDVVKVQERLRAEGGFLPEA